EDDARLAVLDRLQDVRGAFGLLQRSGLRGNGRHFGADVDAGLFAALDQQARGREHAHLVVVGERAQLRAGFAGDVEQVGQAAERAAAAFVAAAPADDAGGDGAVESAGAVTRQPADTEFLVVVERDLGDGDLDHDLARRLVHLLDQRQQPAPFAARAL